MMTSNKYKATVEIQLDEKTYKLKFDYTAISEVISKFGKEIIGGLYETSPADLATIVSIALKDEGVTIDDIMKASPPYFPTARLVDEALGFAYFGPDGPPKVIKADDAKKKPEDQTK